MMRARATGPCISPELTASAVLPTAPGRPATMPERMIMEMPLPIPRSVICSPSHMRNTVPVVMVMVAVTRSGQPWTSVRPPFSRAPAAAKDCTSASPTVPQRVYCVILRRPDSPSLRSSMSVGTTIDIIWMMMEAEMYGMTPMAKIDRRDSAPPENMLTIPRMVLERSPKKRATSAGFTPGTGMKVPMRYTTSAPMRKKKRLRISPKRAASLNAAAGLLMLVFAMPVLCSSSGLDLAAGGFDRRARALGHRHTLERHRPGQGTGEHHLGALGAERHHTRLEQRRQIHQRAFDLGELGEPHLGAASLHGGAETDLRHAPLQRHLAALEADLVVAALARALPLGAAAAGLALAGGGAAAHAQARALASGSGPECVESHTFKRLSRRAAGARRPESCRGSRACPPRSRSGECGATPGRVRRPRCS